MRAEETEDACESEYRFRDLTDGQREALYDCADAQGRSEIEEMAEESGLLPVAERRRRVLPSVVLLALAVCWAPERSSAQQFDTTYLNANLACIGNGCPGCRAIGEESIQYCSRTEGSVISFHEAGRIGIGKETLPPETYLQVGNHLITETPAVQPDVTHAAHFNIELTDFNSKPMAFFGGRQTSAGAGSLQVLEAMPMASHSTGTMSLALGLIGNFQHRGAGTVTDARATYGSAQVWGGGTLTEGGGIWGHYGVSGSGSTCTTCYGVKAASPFELDSGAITTGIGVWIEAQDGTTSYGVKQDGENDVNAFAGAVEVGSVADTKDTYLRVDSESGVPPSGDCNADSERGRAIYDYTNHRLYVCGGASRGWDYAPLTD